MDKNRSSKIIAIAALVVAVVGVSLGFAAFSEVLTINSEAEVKPVDNFTTTFSSSPDGLATAKITGVASEGATADEATLAGNSITGLGAHFTAPGQNVTYTFYVHNDESNSAYDAYLKKITYANLTGESDFSKCTTVDTTTTSDSLVQAACGDITVTVEVGDGANAVTATTTNDSISGHELALGSYEKVVVTIAYANSTNVADGDFKIAFGEISLSYSSNDNAA